MSKYASEYRKEMLKEIFEKTVVVKFDDVFEEVLRKTKAKVQKYIENEETIENVNVHFLLEPLFKFDHTEKQIKECEDIKNNVLEFHIKNLKKEAEEYQNKNKVFDLDIFFDYFNRISNYIDYDSEKRDDMKEYLLELLLKSSKEAEKEREKEIEDQMNKWNQNS